MLETYAFLVIGDTRVDRIDTPDVLQILCPNWLTRPETERRVLQRIKAFLDWAKTPGLQEGNNSAVDVTRGLSPQLLRLRASRPCPIPRCQGSFRSCARAMLKRSLDWHWSSLS